MHAACAWAWRVRHPADARTHAHVHGRTSRSTVLEMFDGHTAAAAAATTIDCRPLAARLSRVVDAHATRSVRMRGLLDTACRWLEIQCRTVFSLGPSTEHPLHYVLQTFLSLLVRTERGVAFPSLIIRPSFFMTVSRALTTAHALRVARVMNLMRRKRAVMIVYCKENKREAAQANRTLGVT